MDLLARREHSYQELEQKLARKKLDIRLIRQQLDQLRDEGLLSDARFLESFIRSKANSGIGPIRIREELIYKGVNAEAIKLALEEADFDWEAILYSVWQKKFVNKPKCNKEKAKQVRFLTYRGFDMNQIMRLIN
ncbi:regulatory protein RecX [Pseudomonas sp. F1_0610]|uniref:regulatory protein RecX n=1 Tax=Pseudomonas sp. F1_0610 TaxID=3114284 RepID=UPI0039C14E7A